MIIFLLCAYNEEGNIGVLVERIRKIFSSKFQYKIVIINDGSTDNTIDILKKYEKNSNIIILTHSKNLGLGKALNTGLNYILKTLNENDILITMDADNTHNPELAVNMIEKINSGFDIVIASRFIKGGKTIGLKFSRKILSYLAMLILKIIFSYKGLNDYTCGYRCYKGKTLIDLKKEYQNNIISEKGFSATVEILIKLLKHKPKICEIPFILRYDFKKGKSKIRIFYTIFRYFILIIKNLTFRMIVWKPQIP